MPKACCNAFFSISLCEPVRTLVALRHTRFRLFQSNNKPETGIDMERRLHTRHRARTTVYVQIPGRRGKLCRARNLSANGVFVETENLGLQKGSVVELAFAINLGEVTKIHRRTAIVAHVTRGGTGLRMESYVGR